MDEHQTNASAVYDDARRDFETALETYRNHYSGERPTRGAARVYHAARQQMLAVKRLVTAEAAVKAAEVWAAKAAVKLAATQERCEQARVKADAKILAYIDASSDANPALDTPANP